MESLDPIASCPLCLKKAASFLTIEGQGHYWRCTSCDSVFMDRKDLLSAEKEKQRYDLHQNDISDPGYMEYLAPLRDEVLKHVARGSRGLDFGCGPSPALAKSLGPDYQIDLYDPFFFADFDLQGKTYDFVMTTEVVEHFTNPNAEFFKLKSLLKPGASLWIMTQLFREEVDFRNWYYRRDPSHIFFYSEKAFTWIQKEFGFSGLTRPHPRVIRFIL